MNKYIIWDRQDKEFKKCKYYQYNEVQKRHYFKHKNCSLWLEDGWALDVFVIGEKGRLVPFKEYLSNHKVKQEEK